MTALCPVCTTESRVQYPATPYYICPNCDCWFQWPQPAKVYIAPFEGDPEQMSEEDRKVNRDLAVSLFKNVMGNRPGRTLDIGAKLPVLASALMDCNCEPIAIDAGAKVDATGWSFPLGVPLLRADFEVDDGVNGCNIEPCNFRLITLIHTFEHLYDPVRAIRKLRKYVAEDGAVFIRSPDHDVKGFERDLTDGHYSIHPFYHSRRSLLQCLVEAKDCFVLSDSWSMDGHGQTDFTLRPIKRKPLIALGVIAKNEANDLPRLLSSASSAVDALCFVDTGSTDDTIEIAQHVATDPSITASTFRHYTGASEKSLDGDWKLQDFSKARNVYLGDAHRGGFDWVLNLDADDQLLTPAAIRRGSYWTQFDIFDMWISDGSSRWRTHRMWKANLGVRYEGRVHEYPRFDNLKSTSLIDAEIVHSSHAQSNQENSNARNMRILKAEWNETPTPRVAFYLANTHRDGGRHAEAVVWYDKRIAMGVGYRDEWLFAHLYQARCLMAMKSYLLVQEVLDRAIAAEPGWAEFYMEMAQSYHAQHLEADAILYASKALNLPIPPSSLWRENNQYLDQPPRMLSHCFEALGDVAKALAWATIAADKIGRPDAEWLARIKRLSDTLIGRGPSSLITSTLLRPLPPVSVRYTSPGPIRRAIALNRPGAIGDILMTLNLIPAFKEANPDVDVHYFCNASLAVPDALGSIILKSGVDQVLDSATLPARRDQYERVIDLIGYPLAEGYPDKPMRLHLLQYFAVELGVEFAALTTDSNTGQSWAPLPALTLQRPELHASALGIPGFDPDRYVTLQRRAGWSKYKTWDDEKWKCLRKSFDFSVVEIDESKGYTLRESIALFANARMHVGVDSFCNHLTNYYWTDIHGGRRVPGVILWGSTQASAAGYPDNTNISLGLPCQPCFRENPAISRMTRGPCVNPPRATYDDDTPWACTRDISVERVVEAVREMWDRTK